MFSCLLFAVHSRALTNCERRQESDEVIRCLNHSRTQPRVANTGLSSHAVSWPGCIASKPSLGWFLLHGADRALHDALVITTRTLSIYFLAIRCYEHEKIVLSSFITLINKRISTQSYLKSISNLPTSPPRQLGKKSISTNCNRPQSCRISSTRSRTPSRTIIATQTTTSRPRKLPRVQVSRATFT
jgi:hypothetical protein